MFAFQECDRAKTYISLTNDHLTMLLHHLVSQLTNEMHPAHRHACVHIIIVSSCVNIVSPNGLQTMGVKSLLNTHTCIGIFKSTIIIWICIYFSLLPVRTCEGDEIQATKRLLNSYQEQNQYLKEQQKILKSKLLKSEQILPSKWLHGLPVIYLITPTYSRLEQKAELTRLSHTLMHVKNIHWIIIEDAYEKTNLVTNFLKRTGLNYTHLYVATPSELKLKPKDPNWLKPRGVLQRNEALSWLRIHTSPDEQPGVVYFADDDNTYSLKLFEEVSHY